MQLTEPQITAVTEWMIENRTLTDFQLRQKFRRDFRKEDLQQDKLCEPCIKSVTFFSARIHGKKFIQMGNEMIPEGELYIGDDKIELED